MYPSWGKLRYLILYYCNTTTGQQLTFVLVIQVSKEKDGKIVDGRCHSLTAAHIRERHAFDNEVPVCSYFEKFEAFGKEVPLNYGVYNIEDLKEFGKDMNVCPYFLARYMVIFKIEYCETYEVETKLGR